MRCNTAEAEVRGWDLGHKRHRSVDLHFAAPVPWDLREMNEEEEKGKAEPWE